MHVAIIMDGNGRWAEQRGLPRTAGHAAGARTVRRIVEAAARMPIDVLTLYAFSSDNWSRPADEVAKLFGLMTHYLRSEAARCVRNGIRVEFIGRRDRVSSELLGLIENIECTTRAGRSLLLRIAVDYSARHEILATARRRGTCCRTIEEFGESLYGEILSGAAGSTAVPGDVDLLIRTGGERRLSDFLLWDCAYAELEFIDAYWPDFDETALGAAIEEFHRRERRFGGLGGTMREASVLG